MGLKSLTFTIILLATSFNALAFQSCENHLSNEDLLFRNENPITFQKVEVYRKNNNYGPQQNGNIKFKLRYDLSYEFQNPNLAASAVGLTPEGRIYHIVEFNNRTIARLLSGHHIITNIEVTNKGRILALDDKGNFYLYSPQKWNAPLKRLILKRWFKLWGLTSLGAVVAKNILLHDFFFSTEILGFAVQLPMLELFFSGAAAMSSGFAMLSKYEDMITYPNGLIPLPSNFNPTNWINNPTLEAYSAKNLQDFDPPAEEILDPRLNLEFTEDIR